MKKSAGIGLGSTSMLIIFVVLCLCTFSTLSFVSARADYRLSKSASEALTAYYAADDRAVERLYKIEITLKSVPVSQNQDYYLQQCEKLLLSTGICEQLDEQQLLFTFTEPVDENRELNVVFKLVKPTAHNHRYTLLQKWQITPSAQRDITVEDSLNLWNGEDELQ